MEIDYAAIPKERAACACCGDSDVIPAVRGDRYEFGLETVVCRRCGLIFTSPRPPAEWFDRFYRDHYRRFYEMVEVPDEAYLARDWIRPRHEMLVAQYVHDLPDTGHILDIGCAEGTFLDVFRSHRPDWELSGIEPSESFAAFARSHYGLEGVRHGHLRDLREWPPGTYDLVTANHLLEHLLDPNELFRAARRLLKDQGLLLVDVPDAEGESHGLGNLHIAHVHHFSLQTLGNFFAKHGFRARWARKGCETPQWTLQMMGRKEAKIPREWSPPPVESREIARSFRRHCVPPLHRRAISRVRRALRAG